jgi:Bacterial regulatory helix-turn-helix protein, lysR family
MHVKVAESSAINWSYEARGTFARFYGVGAPTLIRFSGAAEELRISQPAVSKHIADLERQLGTKSIERGSGALTLAGDFLASHVLRAEAILAQAVYAMGARREPELGSLSIRAAGISGTYLLPVSSCVSNRRIRTCV